MDYKNVIDQLLDAGLLIEGCPDIGQFTRCAVEGDKRGKKSGWYVLHELPLDNGTTALVGRYGNWKLGSGNGFKIKFDAGGLSQAERQRLQAEQRLLREVAGQEREQRAADAAVRAARIWAELPVSGSSAYLKRKQVKAWGVKFSRGSVVVPLVNEAGQMVGLQFIAGDGTKKFLTGTPKTGSFHLCGEIPPGSPRTPLCVAEGYATAATIHEATDWPCAVAFDAGNLLPVAQALRRLYPDHRLMICGDDDYLTPGNPGRTMATAAAVAVGARVVFPDFGAVA